MKKTIKIMLTLAFVIAALCVTASAEGTNGFYDIGTVDSVAIEAFAGTNETAITATEADVDADDTAETYYENSDRLGVTYSAATAGEDYGVILVEGSSLPTASSAIYYINQDEAADTSIAFDVYPATITAPSAEDNNRDMTLYISSSAEGAELVSVPMNYVVGYEEVVEPEVMYGDATDDGKINVFDVARIKKYLADNSTDINLANADATGDGKVNVFDVARVKKYLADNTTTLGPAA